MPSSPLWSIILDILQGFEYASGIYYAEVLNMLQYSFNNNFIVTNIIIFELLSLPFVQPSTPPQLTTLTFSTRVRR